ncbi:MAG: hypothetical protein M3P27_02880 [Acidobacteriota bacterium]|nr:hypothetical protein [Acidobacteriota bacterium]
MSKREVNVWETAGSARIGDGIAFVRVSFSLRKETTIVSDQYGPEVAKVDISGNVKPEDETNWGQITRWADSNKVLSLAPGNSEVIGGIRVKHDGSFRAFSES